MIIIVFSDVWNGNVKCIMRLLLALAANFKTYRPESRYEKGTDKPTHRHTDKHNNKPTHRHTDKHNNKPTHRNTNGNEKRINTYTEHTKQAYRLIACVFNYF